VRSAAERTSLVRGVMERRATEHFGEISVAIIDDRDAFGLGLFQLGFGSPTSATSSAFATR
jgi:hypothetical protein